MAKELNLTYYAKLTKEDNGYIATFRDLSNVFTEGDTIEETLSNAQEALDEVLAEMTLMDYNIPLPSSSAKNEYPVPVSPNIAAPILLHLLRKQRTQTITNVAQAMNIPYQQYQRLEHNCNMTLKSLKKAISALGGRVEIKVYTD